MNQHEFKEKIGHILDSLSELTSLREGTTHDINKDGYFLNKESHCFVITALKQLIGEVNLDVKVVSKFYNASNKFDNCTNCDVELYAGDGICGCDKCGKSLCEDCYEESSLCNKCKEVK